MEKKQSDKLLFVGFDDCYDPLNIFPGVTTFIDNARCAHTTGSPSGCVKLRANNWVGGGNKEGFAFYYI